MEDTTELKLSVIMPVYNEANTIDRIIEKVLSRDETGELIIVNDGSTDRTPEKIDLWAGKDGRVRIIHHEKNTGKGSAIASGLKMAKMSVILPQDADLEYDPSDYILLLRPFRENGVKVVYGSRFLDSMTKKAKTPLWHAFGNKALTLITNIILGTNLTDEATCYKAFHRELIDKIALQEKGFGFCPEITAKISKLGVAIREVPISYSGRSKREGKKIRFRHGAEALWCLVRYRFFA